MTNEEIKNSNYIIFNDQSIQEAMESITYNHRGCVVVVNRDWGVLGVISDGDIRRAMVSGATQITPIEKIINTNFVVLTESGKNKLEDVYDIFKDHPKVSIVPVVDDSNKLVDIIIKGGVYNGTN